MHQYNQDSILPAVAVSVSVSGSHRIVRYNGVSYVRQPCKARGVKALHGQDPHIAKYAYIDIPVGTQHGTVLSCSHLLCCSSGRMFRYCVECKAAVAKRNFNVRHGHPGAVLLKRLPRGRKKSVVTQVGNNNGERTNNQSGDKIHVDEVLVAVPPSLLPSFNQKKEVNSAINETSKALVTASLTRYELDVIQLLRRRPRHDCLPGSEETWRRELLSLFDRASVGVKSCPISAVDQTECRGGVWRYSAPHEFDVYTPDCNDKPDDEFLFNSDLDVDEMSYPSSTHVEF